MVKTLSNITTTYKYNGDGYRVEKTEGSTTAEYLYEEDKVVLETDETGKQISVNVYGTNLISKKTDSDTAFYLYNGHADVTALMGESGNIMASYRYDAFGNVIEHTGIDSNITYAGYQYDKETDLYYLNARYYDSKIARFMTEDTYTGEANDPLSLNLYTYCYNNPIIYIDPTGHYVSDWDRDNLSRDAITQLENCGAAWNIARANNDKEGMAIAHQSAEIIRNSTGLRDGTNVKGNANGNTMVVNSSGQLSVYVSQNSSTQRQQEINETRRTNWQL